MLRMIFNGTPRPASRELTQAAQVMDQYSQMLERKLQRLQAKQAKQQEAAAQVAAEAAARAQAAAQMAQTTRTTQTGGTAQSASSAKSATSKRSGGKLGDARPPRKAEMEVSTELTEAEEQDEAAFDARQAPHVAVKHDASDPLATEMRRLRKMEIWTRGMLSSLNELEQSVFAEEFYAARVQNKPVEEMTEDEQLDYARYVYFDKNSFIRMFSVLDKLGTLLNEALHLQTENYRPRFTYFTVLRHMEYHKKHPALYEELNKLREEHQQAIDRLRLRRNMDVHVMNSEVYDDLMQSFADVNDLHFELEDVKAQSIDLRNVLNVVLHSFIVSYQYLGNLAKQD